MGTQIIDSTLFKNMIVCAAANLKQHSREINELNVFPIPDGDTGDNMLYTVLGGVNADTADSLPLDTGARKIADGMLLSARGNSGVILSQFFDGIAQALRGIEKASVNDLSNAFSLGVTHAYDAVLEPTEGTILTVVREATNYALKSTDSIEVFFDDFLEGAKSSLKRTPQLLPVLKKAGVVDSGGAGLICIVEGMKNALHTDPSSVSGTINHDNKNQNIDFSKFDENSILEFGYCTELLLRLQNAKTDIENFDINLVTDYLKEIGESVVAVKNGSIIKIHIHTMTPDRVLAFCRNYGEFLTVKIENMSLQHNSIKDENDALSGFTVSGNSENRKKFALVTVASGSGIQHMFTELGADFVINGGQSMNPSSKDFIDAFEKVNADTIFVLPNNGNIILTAQQAAKLYSKSDIRVINSKTIGEGHCALTMLNTESNDPDIIEAELNEAINGVITAMVSTCSRNTQSDGFSLYKGEYIGFIGDKILSADNDRLDTSTRLIDSIDFEDREVCIIICGKNSSSVETNEIRLHILQSHPLCEIFITHGNQDLYDYIFIIE